MAKDLDLSEFGGAPQLDLTEFQDAQKPSGALRRGVADKAVGFASGAIGATKAIADAAGAGNAVSGALDSANKAVDDYLSPEAKADQQEQQRIMDEAKGKGVWEGIKAGARAFAEAPVQTAVQGLGSVVPVLAGGVAGLPGALATGAAIGAGSVKGSIYNDIKKRGMDAGLSELEASARADAAQSYTGENADQIALGVGLGAADAATGVSRIAGNMVRSALRKPVQEIAKDTAERGLIASALRGAASEAPLEAAQGGQEQVAANVAAQRAGYNVDTWEGVASKATLEGLASVGPGGVFGAMDRGAVRKPVPGPVDPPSTEQAPAAAGPFDGTPPAPYINTGVLDANGLTPKPPAPVLDTQRLDAMLGTPSQQMGLDPAAGPMSAAAAIAVDTGAHGAEVQAAQAMDEALQDASKDMDPDMAKAWQQYRAESAGMQQDQSGTFQGAQNTNAQDWATQAAEEERQQGPLQPQPQGMNMDQRKANLAKLKERMLAGRKQKQEPAQAAPREESRNALPQFTTNPQPDTLGTQTTAKAGPGFDASYLPNQGNRNVREATEAVSPSPQQQEAGNQAPAIGSATTAATGKTGGSSVQTARVEPIIQAKKQDQPTPVKDEQLSISEQNDNESQPAQPAANAGEGAGVSQPTQAAPLPPTDIKLGDKVLVDGKPHTVTHGVDGGIAVESDATDIGNGVSNSQTRILKGDDAIKAKIAADDAGMNKAAPNQPALDRIASGNAWFGNELKARNWLQKNGLAETHDVTMAKPGRFEVVQKAAKAPVDIAPAAINSVADDRGARIKSALDNGGRVVGDQLRDRNGMGLMKLSADELAGIPADKVRSKPDPEKAKSDTLATAPEAKSDVSNMQTANAEPVTSQFTGQPDSKNSAPVQELDGFKTGQMVDIPSRTFGKGKIDTLYTRKMAGLGEIPMARVVREDGKKLDVGTSELKAVEKPAVSPLVQAMNDLAEVRQRIADQGQVVDDRLLSRERQLKALVKELETGGQNDELDAEMRSYESKVPDEKPATNDETPDFLLRQHAQKERMLDGVQLTSGGFVTMERAVSFAKKYMDPADWTKPFQFNRVLDVAPIDWDRMVAAMSTQKQAPAIADIAPAATETVAKVGRFDHIQVPDETTRWMGFDGRKTVKADLQALAQRHSEYYQTAQQVRDDIEFVLGKPDGWYIHKDNKVVLFRERIGEGAIPQARVEVEADADSMAVRSVYVGGKRQIAKKMADKRELLGSLDLGGQSPDSLTIADYLKVLGNGSSRPASPSGEVLKADASVATPAQEVKAALSEREKAAKAKMLNAVAKLAHMASKNTRMNWTQEEKQQLLPIVIDLFDGAIELGAVSFQKAVAYVRDFISSNIDQETADSIPFKTLKGAYIAATDGRTDAGITSDSDVAQFTSLAELENSADKADTSAKPSLNGPEGRHAIAQSVADHFIGGGKFDTIIQARKFISELTGEKIESSSKNAKLADETIEMGVVLAGREMVKAGRNQKRSDQTIYDRLVSLYNAQPNLSVRSSTSVEQQAYSTPIPLAFVASRLAKIKKGDIVAEPTAGNSALVLEVLPAHTVINELNDDRIGNLKAMGFTPTQKNAATEQLAAPKSVDAAVMNPPFGAVKDDEGKTIYFDVPAGPNTPALNTREIDHAIVFNSLSTIKDDGRAVLIVGGVDASSEDQIRDGYRGKGKREFYYKLYNEYKVTDHFTVDGGLYSRQGAGYPVDVIVIDGRGKSARDLPAAKLPQRIMSYDQLKEKLNEANTLVPTGSGTGVRVGSDSTGVSHGTDVATSSVGAPDKNGIAGAKPGASIQAGSKGDGVRPILGQSTGSGSVSGGGKLGTTGTPTQPDGTLRGGSVAQAGVSGGSGRKAGDGGNRSDDVGGNSSLDGKLVGSGLTDRRGQEAETENQVGYTPKSGKASVGTLVPVNMRDAIQESLSKVADDVGDLDDYVAKALGYTSQELGDYLSAEQIDALALAIYNAEQGKGFIIGDQTGIGKGRVNAAMIRYAIKKGQVPIFITEKPNLYADMIRDLDDIGMAKDLDLEGGKPHILMTNNGESIPYELYRNVNGEVVEHKLTLKAPKSNAKDAAALLAELAGNGELGRYKVIFSTYSQLQSIAGKATERQRFLTAFAKDNFIIFDESHNAGGTGEAQDSRAITKVMKASGMTVPGRAGFARSLVKLAKGTFFSSATYAKRPDVMDLYSSTNMSLAVDKPADLATAIKSGGVPLQQAVATMLTADGQYIRRERTFAGVSYETQLMPIDRQTGENMAESMRWILAFSRAKEALLAQMQKEFDKEGAIAQNVGGEKTQVAGANFGSVMHNLIDQMLLALKVEESVKLAIAKLKAGEKVVLTVSNTMGSFLKDYADEMGIRPGDAVSLSFKDLYLRYLDKQRKYRVKSPGGQVKEKYLTDAELGHLLPMHNKIQAFIQNAGFGSAPISPIDYMHNELRKAGYKTDEITGRTATVDYEGGIAKLASRTAGIKQRLKAIGDFNSGATDVLILNQSGSTGLSLHASAKFKDQKKRHMIIVQAEKNIDTHMQMLGRVHRTGQVVTPGYTQAMADTPAEMRPAAVLSKKMAGLSANTTASRKSAVAADGVVDFINEYGGQVAAEFLQDNPEVHDALGGQSRIEVPSDLNEAGEELIRKLTGYIPILPLKQQEQIYADLIERYNDLIARENSMGTNRLETKALDLDAKTLTSEKITANKGSATETSVFAEPANMEQVDVKRNVKPLTPQELEAAINETLNGVTKQQYNVNLVNKFDTDIAEYLAESLAKIDDSTDSAKLIKDQKEAQIGLQRLYVRRVLNTYIVGDSVTITDKNASVVHGVITGITHNQKTKNPAAGSAWKMTFALANGDARTMSVGFGQLGQQFSVNVTPGTVPQVTADGKVDRVMIRSLFENGNNIRREKRWMVTGNLLAGFSKYQGQIVSYTKADGGTGQGVLMNRQFDYKKEKGASTLSFSTSAQAIEFLTKAGRNAVLGSPDRVLRIVALGGDRYSVMVPSSKREGGSLYLDRGLLDAFGSDFYKQGQNMSMRIDGNDTLERGLNYLIAERDDVSLAALTNQDVARKVLGMDDAPKAVFSQNLVAPKSLGPKPTPDQIQRLVDKVLQVAKNVVPVSIIGNPSQIHGVNVPAGSKPTGAVIGGRVYLFSDNISSIGDAYVTLFHELFHLGLQKVIPAEDYATLLRKFSRNLLVQKFVRQWKASPEGVEKAQTMNSAAYDALAAEEALAMVSEELSVNNGIGTNRTPGLVKAMLSWIAEVVDKMGFPAVFGKWMRGLTQTDAERFVSQMVSAALGGPKSLASAQAKYGTTLAQMTKQTRLSAGAETHGTNDAMTNNDVVGNQGGRSADDTTPGVKPKHSPEQMAKWAAEKKARDEARMIESNADREMEKRLARRSDTRIRNSDMWGHFTDSEKSDIDFYSDATDKIDEGKKATINAIERALKNAGITIEHTSSSNDGKSKSLYVKLGDQTIRVSDHELPMTPSRENDRSRGLTGKWDREVIVSEWQNSTMDEYLSEIGVPAAKRLGYARSERNIANGDTGNTTTNESTAPDSGGAPVAQTDTPAFRNWFGDSKVVDADGKPLVVYHGTEGEVNVFEPYWKQLERDARPHELQGNGSIAQLYKAAKQDPEMHFFAAERGTAESYGQDVVKAYLKIENMVGSATMARDEALKLMLDSDADGAMFHDTTSSGRYGGVAYVIRKSNQAKSATSNNGQFDGTNPDIRFRSGGIGDTLTNAANSARDVNLPAGYKVGDLFNSVPGKLNWWYKTVGTQYNLAQRSPAFKRVYDAVQTFINDVSYFATEAADLAPNILPKLESWKDILKSPLSAADTKALSAPVFEGTLTWARDESGKPVKMAVLEEAAKKLTTEQKAQRLLRGDHISQNVLKMWQGLPIDQFESLIEGKYESDMLKAGIVFTPAELKSLFSLNDKQVSLYQEFRKAVDKSLTNLAVADMIRFGGKDVDPIREQVLESKTVGEAAEMLRDYLLSVADENDVLIDTANKMIDKGDKAQGLMDRGYAPLSRFGTYTLDVVDANGERAYFGMFESAAEASKMRRKMEGLYPGSSITQGTVSEEAYKMFAGVSPETLELFGDMLGLESQGDSAASQAFQEYLKLAKSSRSAMKRLIQRKGIAGFSEDAGRVLAGFVYSNARQTASSLHMGEMTNAANDIDQTQGELKDAAVKLVEYIKNPREEAQALRGLLFAQYIGGSVASAMVNMTQPFTMTFPWLSQYGGAASAAKQMTAAMKDQGKKLTGDAKLDAALRRAEEDGTVSPQEVHQLMQQSQGRGALQSGDGTRAGDALAKANNALSKIGLAWGKLFGVAEQFNRRVTFIAAYRTAVAQGMANPDAFARKAIAETQGVYNKGNKPAWARGAVGSTLFTFKQYSIAYVEMLSRMAKAGAPGSSERAQGQKAALLALAVLFLMAGAGGMPGADDLDDVISGAMQSMGYNFDSKMKRKEFFVSILGEDGARFMERGISGLPGVPIDVSGRLGLGNLLPGTGLFTKKADHTRDVAEIFGPMGDFAKRGFDAAGSLITGDVGEAVNAISPKAVQNLAQAYDMANMGMYRDAKGMKVLDTDAVDAAVKAIGFQPNDVKRAQDANFEAKRMIDLNRINESEIANQWAMGIFEKDTNKVKDARDRLAEWNEANPESPIRINFQQIRSRVQKMNETKSQRIAKTAPKEIRAAVRQELATH